MIALLQKVTEASVCVSQSEIARIDAGLLVLLAVESTDTKAELERLAARLLGFRMFPDAAGKMNLNVKQAGGAALLVPQFTLAADTRSGRRPSFSAAAPPALATGFFDAFVERIREDLPMVETGQFGAYMQVALVNDGPATFWLQEQAVQPSAESVS